MNALNFVIACVGFATIVALVVTTAIYVYDYLICAPDPEWERDAR